MKKFTLVGLLIFAIVLSGCNKTNITNGGSNYQGELIIKGVGPEISMEPTVDEGTLVLRGYFEDHTDHVFLRAGTREDKFSNESEYLPGNTVKFKGYVNPLDGAAGNHYYDVINVESIKSISFADTTGVKDLLESYNYCESDDDCTYITGECPFGCFIPFNKKFKDISTKILENYFNINGATCVYDCLYMDTVICENYKCVMKNSEEINNEALIIDDEGANDENQNGQNEDEISQNEDEGIIRNNGDCCSCCKDLKPGESCIALCCPCDD